MSKRKVPEISPETWMTNKKSEHEEKEEEVTVIERNPLKSLIIGGFNFNTNEAALTRIDFHRESFHPNSRVLPLDFLNLRSCILYEFAVLESRVYIIGGCGPDYTLYYFDLQNPSSLGIATPMQQPRIPSVVFTYKNNIYVFGWEPDDHPLTRETYAEYYDPVSDKWFNLKFDPPQDIIQPVLSHALNEEAGVLYIWVACTKIYQYNLEAKTWDKWLPPNEIYPFKCTEQMPRKVHCLRNFLIWNFGGTVHAYCLSDARSYQFPISFRFTFDPFWCSVDPNFLDLGNGKLCLIHRYESEYLGTADIKCHVFSVKFSKCPPDDVQIDLQHESSEDLGVVDSYVSAVLAV